MISFSDEAFFYLTWGGVIQFLCAVVAAPFVYLVWLRLSRGQPPDFIRAYLVMNLFLLLWGCLGNYGFLLLASGTHYVSVDRWVDWFPFIPFGKWNLSGMGPGWEGHLIGTTTMAEMRLLWLAVAVPVWILSLWSTKLALRAMRSLLKSRHRARP